MDTKASDLSCGVLQRFERNRNLAPDRLAVVCGDSRWTYRQLGDFVDRLASGLVQAGVGVGDVVALCLDRSPELVGAVLGVMRAGAAYLPMDPGYPSSRVRQIIGNACPAKVVADRAGCAILSDLGVPSIGIEDLLSKEVSSLPPWPGQTDLAYIIYTSGSTGAPKGVCVTHANLEYSTAARINFYAEPVQRFLLLSTFAFDSSVAGLFWTLSCGGCLELPVPGQERDIGALAEILQKQPVSHYLTLPSVHSLILERLLMKPASSLKVAIVAGESCHLETVERHHKICPTVELYNEYGPTEATVWASACKLSIELCQQSVPIGQPIAGTRIWIGDGNGNQVEHGEVGELTIIGPGVSQGYYRSEPSAKFSKIGSESCYHTGDRARWRCDGFLEFHGRLDDQVKLRGYRIELGEVERALYSLAGAVDAAVAVSRDGQQLVAYLVSEEKPVPTVGVVQQVLSERLPKYMVPAFFVFLSEIPRTAHGKLDRQALPRPTSSRPNLDQKFLAPRDELECVLAELWRKELGLDRVGVLDRFFELGGSSLIAARVINSLAKQLEESIFVVTIFEAPTIAEYAKLLKRDYSEAVKRHFGITIAEEKNRERQRISPKKLSVTDLQTLIEAIPNVVPKPPTKQSAMSQQALFILAPPRSGTTLLRVMLAGHPQLFAADELQLMHFGDMAARAQAYSGPLGLWRDGFVRVVRELADCSASEAQQIVVEFEQRAAPIQEVLQWIFQHIGDRWLVDKSPSYVLDMQTLQKIERDFVEPKYIQLLRHPYAMVRSFERKHMDQVMFLDKHKFSCRELGELIWTQSHRNAHEFAQQLPDRRIFKMHYEQLVSEPEKVMRAMCSQLDLSYHPDLILPYKNIEQKMTDGVHPESTPMGDDRFREHSTINPALADSWQGVERDNFLSDLCWEVAVKFGYFPAKAPLESSNKSGRDRLRARRSRKPN